jgi:XTP/dITP diphosphohydrolase
MLSFIFATHNNYKVQEVSKILQRDDLEILSLRDIGYTDEIIEDGSTLEKNAWIKADTIYKAYRRNVIAEDTGLEIEFLENRPGIHTARYAGPQRNDDDNMKKVLGELSDVVNRSARFRTVLAVWFNDRQITFEGICHGKIAESKSGKGGFGYDPIFIPDGYTQTFGQLSAQEKNSISHRYKAFKKLKDFLAGK